MAIANPGVAAFLIYYGFRAFDRAEDDGMGIATLIVYFGFVSILPGIIALILYLHEGIASLSRTRYALT